MGGVKRRKSEGDKEEEGWFERKVGAGRKQINFTRSLHK